VFVDYYFYVGAVVRADGLCWRLKTGLVASSSRLLWLWLVAAWTVVVEHGSVDCLRIGVLVVMSLPLITPPPSSAGCC